MCKRTRRKPSSSSTSISSTYPAVVDSGTLSDQYHINGMPVGVFIDKTGVVKKIEIGELSPEQLTADIKSIL